MTTIIFILELVALATLIICGALLLLDAGSKKKQPEHKPEPQQPQRIAKHPGRCKRRPKGQTGRKLFRTRLTAPWEILSSSANAWGFPHRGLKPVSFVAGIWP